jgi:hypothetical protein
VWRGDIHAIEPMLDAVMDTGSKAEQYVSEALKSGEIDPKHLRQRLVDLGKGGTGALQETLRRSASEADWYMQNRPLMALEEDQDEGQAAPTVGERVRVLGRKVRRVARKVGRAALKQLPKDVLPPGPRRTLYGWDSYVKRNGLPRDELPESNTPPPPIKFSGVQAPAGGVVVRGLFYPGGKWIPSANLEKASYPQYQHVEDQRARMQKKKNYKREDGSVDVQGALDADGSKEALKLSKGSYTPGVHKGVEAARKALGRGGFSPPPSAGKLVPRPLANRGK